MLDPATAREGFAVSKELVRGLMWLVNRRGLLRAEVLENEILPQYEAMKLNHDDFRYILGKLDRAFGDLELQIDNQRNDFDPTLRALDALLDELQERRDRLRSDRPALRASAQSYRERLENAALSKKFALSSDEIDTASRFFATIVDYFTADQAFGHDLGHLIRYAYRITRWMRQRGADPGLSTAIIELREKVVRSSSDREAMWQEISEAFGTLSTRLRQAKS